MGGKISVKSNPGAGTTFSVVIPFEILIKARSEQNDAVVGAEDEKTMPPAYRGHVLLVEDSPTNVLVAQTFVHQFGYSCDVAESGLAAIENVRATEYDAILMDIQMPGMNGLETTQAIRRFEKSHHKKQTPIIGMTAHTLLGDRERCLKAGMNDYIGKPFQPTELESTLHRYAR
jgi:CheY-like chemotaxis protein